MKNKVILQILNNNDIVEETEFKDIYSISKHYQDNVSYYHLREIYLKSMNKNKRRNNLITDELFNTIRIIDNPKIKKEFKNIFTPKQNEFFEPVVAAP
jgi:hypothetical protein